MEGTERQEQIYYCVADYQHRHGIPPVLREIGSEVGLPEPSEVKHHIPQLVAQGLLDLEPGKARGLSLHGIRHYPVPLVGYIAAGRPLRLPQTDFSPANFKMISVPGDIAGPGGKYFALQVKGMSMIDALVRDGDRVILRCQNVAENGEMVAATLIDENEVTLKYFYLELDKNRVRLQPAHPTMEPWYVHPSNVRIEGKVVGVIRRL